MIVDHVVALGIWLVFMELKKIRLGVFFFALCILLCLCSTIYSIVQVNCPFYFKMGACRHGDRCTRQHHKPPFSQTIIIPHMWTNPLVAVAAAEEDVVAADDEGVQDNFNDFYEEAFEEFRKHGKIEEIHVVENLGDHMSGNCYVKYEGNFLYLTVICANNVAYIMGMVVHIDEEEAERALKAIQGRYYAGNMLHCEYSPVTDFSEARCRQYDDATCARGGYCNFLHVREPSRPLRKHLERVSLFRVCVGIFIITLC